MDSGTVAVATLSQNQGAPSAVGFVVGSPSPSTPFLTQIIQAGNSFASSWSDVISSIPKKTVSAVTSVSNQAKYKGDIVLGTIAKGYNQTVAGALGAVADTGQGALNVAKKVETVAAVGTTAIGLYLLIPIVLAWYAMRKK